MDAAHYVFLANVFIFSIVAKTSANVNEKPCVEDICGGTTVTPSCPDGGGVILIRNVLRPESSPVLGSCTRAGVFNLLSKVCNARHTCEQHLVQQIRNQCCSATSSVSPVNKLDITYNCIKANTIFDLCSSHRHPVPDFHRHVISPNFTEESARRDILMLPFCQWSIPIPRARIFRLSVNDFFIGPRTSCEDETSFRLQYMDKTGRYKHVPSAILCNASANNLESQGFSRQPITLPEGSTKAVVWFTPISYKERLWFSYQFVAPSDIDEPYNMEGVSDCGVNKYIPPRITTPVGTSSIEPMYGFNTTATQSTPISLHTTTVEIATTVSQARAETEITSQPYPAAPVTKSSNILTTQCSANVLASSDESHSSKLQRFILIGALAGVSVVAIIFFITSLVLFMKLVSRPRASSNGLVRFIKADRLDSKPVVMEVECVDRTTKQFPLSTHTSQAHRSDLFIGDIRDRTFSMQSTDSPEYAMPYKQPTIRYGSSKRHKPVQHRVKIVEETRSNTLESTKGRSQIVALIQSPPTYDGDTLSLISGCTVSSSEVSVSDLETAELKDLIKNLKDNVTPRPRSSSVKVRAEMRRPRFPPDIGTNAVVRISREELDDQAQVQYDNYKQPPSHNGSYDVCRPFPTSSDDCLINPLYEAVESK